jgi:hypothetical protein
MALKSGVAAEKSKDRHLRDFRSFSIFDFFNTIRQKRSFISEVEIWLSLCAHAHSPEADGRDHKSAPAQFTRLRLYSEFGD